MKAARREALEGYLFIAPWLIGFILFMGGPIAAVFGISLTKWSMLDIPEFIGLKNYQSMLRDALFWKSLQVTFIYLLSVPLHLTLGLFIAILLNQKIRALGFFRTVYYIPSVTAGVATAILWTWVFHSRFGLLNSILGTVGIQGPVWLGSEMWVLPALIVMSIWGVGGTMLIYLSALQSVPTVLYEAATVDGASFWHKFWHITIPMISPVILFNGIMLTIAAFQIFTPVYIMTQGGPNYASLVYVLNLYWNAFKWYRFGYASALGWILFLIILVATYVYLRFSAGWIYYAAERGRR